MHTREKYDCNECGRRIEKKWLKSSHVPVRIFEECYSAECRGKLQTYSLISSLYGVSQPESENVVTYCIKEGLCRECCEDEATHWGVCGSCYWKQEQEKNGWHSTWNKDLEEKDEA